MRNELRFLSNALVYVVDKANKETEVSLRDLSEHGLSIKSKGYIDIEPNSPYVVAIIPEEETNIKKFQLEIESRWVKINKSKMESGFSVIVPFDKEEFDDYLEYLAMRGKVQTFPDDEDKAPDKSQPAYPAAPAADVDNVQVSGRDPSAPSPFSGLLPPETPDKDK